MFDEKRMNYVDETDMPSQEYCFKVCEKRFHDYSLAEDMAIDGNQDIYYFNIKTEKEICFSKNEEIVNVRKSFI